jgi:type IV secretion system protein VirB10
MWNLKAVPILVLACAALAAGRQPPAAAEPQAEAAEPAYTVATGTRIPLNLINGISTKTAADGDRVYLQTSFPIVSGGRVVIPPGSYVTGTISSAKRPGKVKGRGELYLRFDSLTLPNGVTRDFRARIGALDGTNPGQLDRSEGRVESDGSKGNDSRVVAESTIWGTVAGSAIGRSGMGAGIGAAAGATAGLVGVLLSRGQEAIIERGSTVEMILDRDLTFTATELDFGPAAGRPPQIGPARSGTPAGDRRTLPNPRRPPGII